jgi:hypothetical protein
MYGCRNASITRNQSPSPHSAICPEIGNSSILNPLQRRPGSHGYGTFPVAGRHDVKNTNTMAVIRPASSASVLAAIWRRGTPIVLMMALLSVAAAAENSSETDETGQQWISLFDGQTTDGWRNYQASGVSSGWQVADGLLLRTGPDAGDLITEATYDDFELRLEWRVESGGNSGIFFRATETEPRIYLSAPEVQILDDANHRDGKSPLTSAGSNYGLHPAPRGIVRPAGEWNQVRLRVKGDHVTQWLNGVQVVDYQLGSDDWQVRVANSKFANWPNYGKARSGHIGLQDHGDPVAFRNIEILILEDTP